MSFKALLVLVIAGRAPAGRTVLGYLAVCAGLAAGILLLTG